MEDHLSQFSSAVPTGVQIRHIPSWLSGRNTSPHAAKEALGDYRLGEAAATPGSDSDSDSDEVLIAEEGETPSVVDLGAKEEQTKVQPPAASATRTFDTTGGPPTTPSALQAPAAILPQAVVSAAAGRETSSSASAESAVAGPTCALPTAALQRREPAQQAYRCDAIISNAKRSGLLSKGLAAAGFVSGSTDPWGGAITGGVAAELLGAPLPLAKQLPSWGGGAAAVIGDAASRWGRAARAAVWGSGPAKNMHMAPGPAGREEH